MAKEESIAVREKWLDLKSMPWPNGVTTEDVSEVTTAGPFRVTVEVMLPPGRDISEFNAAKATPLQRFREKWKQNVADSLAAIVRFRNEDRDGDDEAFKKADTELKRINGVIEESISEFRELLKTTITEFVNSDKGNARLKANDLMTIGSNSFRKLAIRPGTFENETAAPTAVLDISKALTRKKWQFCGVAWKSGVAVITIRLKKPYKPAELKELKESLPDGKDRGAKMIAGRIRASSATKVEFEFENVPKVPKRKTLVTALKEQTGKAVFVDKEFGVWEPEPEEDATKTGKSTGTKKKAKKTSPPKTSKKKTKTKSKEDR